jgi:hypothetical protein
MEKCNICNRPKGQSIGYCFSGQGEGFTKGQYLRDCLDHSKDFLFQEKYKILMRHKDELDSLQEKLDEINDLIKDSYLSY